MKDNYCLLLSIMIVVAVHGQHGASPGPGIRNIPGYNTLSPLYNNGSYIAEKGNEVNGTPFLYEQWLTGNIEFVNGERFDSLQLRFLLVTNELQLKIEDKEYIFTVPVKSFELMTPDMQHRKFISAAAMSNNTRDKFFYEVLYDGKTSLLLNRKKEIVTDVTNVPGLKTKKYEEVTALFIGLSKGRIERLKKNSRYIMGLLSDKQQQLSAYIDQQRLDLSNDADIIKLLQYYDSIQ